MARLERGECTPPREDIELNRLRAELARYDGGTWSVRYLDTADARNWSEIRRKGHTHQKRVWHGPVEPISEETP
jgi:hypothetical protein